MKSDTFDQDYGLSRLVIDILTNVADFTDSEDWQECENDPSLTAETVCQTFSRVLAKRIDEHSHDQRNDGLLASLGEYLDAIEQVCGKARNCPSLLFYCILRRGIC